MQKLSVKEAEKILERQALLWQKMKARAKSEGSKPPMIHIEFADFSNEKFFSIYDKHVVRSADSLGMNEQELKMIIDHWSNNQSLNEAKDSNPSFEDILK